jgi:hypothetical protein
MGVKNIFSKVLFFIVVTIFCIEAKVYKSFDAKTSKHKTQKHKELLFENVGCKYTNKMVIDPEVSMISAYDSQYFKDYQEVIFSLSERYKKDVEKYVLAPMYLQYVSPVIGYGVFAASPIKSGDFIGVYGGILRNLHWEDPNFKEDVDYAWYYTIANKQDQNMIVDGKYEGNELRFINHVEDPNTRRIDVVVNDKFYVCYVACRDIQKDEELTVSYGTGYWSSRGITPERSN